MDTMNKTHVRPARDLRNNYAELAKIVKNEHSHVILTNRGRGDMVLIDFEDYDLYTEHLHQKYTEAKLAEAIEQSQSPEVKWIPGEDVLKEARTRLAQLEEAAKRK